MSTPPTNECVQILVLAKLFYPAHVKGSSFFPISKKFFSTEKSAKAVTSIYASRNNLKFDGYFYETERPFLTIVKREDLWYPAAVHKEGIEIFNVWPGVQIKLGSSREDAINTTALLALVKDAPYTVNLGMKLLEWQKALRV